MMSKEKQIEELAEILRKVCDATPNGKCMSKLCCACRAETVIEAGYRKQSEDVWISVEERVPEPKKWVLVFTRHMHHPVVCFYEDVWYFLGGFFSKGQATHWMPLPEPPDMKEV